MPVKSVIFFAVALVAFFGAWIMYRYSRKAAWIIEPGVTSPTPDHDPVPPTSRQADAAHGAHIRRVTKEFMSEQSTSSPISQTEKDQLKRITDEFIAGRNGRSIGVVYDP